MYLCVYARAWKLESTVASVTPKAGLISITVESLRNFKCLNSNLVLGQHIEIHPIIARTITKIQEIPQTIVEAVKVVVKCINMSPQFRPAFIDFSDKV